MQNWLRVAVMVIILLGGCASTPPAPLREDSAPVTQQQAQDQNLVGQHIRWGGEIIETTPGKDTTCFELLGHPLDQGARPIIGGLAQGRFIACAPGFYDPAVYVKGRELTVVGTLNETIAGKIGGYDYRYPHVQVEQLYLWHERPEAYPSPPYYGPFYDPFYDPFWFRRYRCWPYYW